MPGDGPRAARGSAPRLRKSRDIQRVTRTGLRLHSGRVIVFLAPGTGRSRAAWVAGRRVGGAVSRNRARRLLREAWWALAPRIRDGYDLVMVARRPMEDIKAHGLIEELEGVLESAGMFRR